MKVNCPYCHGLGQNYFYEQEQEAQSFACLKCNGTGLVDVIDKSVIVKLSYSD